MGQRSSHIREKKRSEDYVGSVLSNYMDCIANFKVSCGETQEAIRKIAEKENSTVPSVQKIQAIRSLAQQIPDLFSATIKEINRLANEAEDCTIGIFITVEANICNLNRVANIIEIKNILDTYEHQTKGNLQDVYDDFNKFVKETIDHILSLDTVYNSLIFSAGQLREYAGQLRANRLTDHERQIAEILKQAADLEEKAKRLN